MQAQEKKNNDLTDLSILPERDIDFLDGCYVYTFRAGGKGGQHVNKTDSAVRIVHKATGITATCSRERSQYLNKKRCIQNLRKKIEVMNTVAPERIPTSVPRSVKLKRIEKKSAKAKKKKMRQRDMLFE